MLIKPKRKWTVLLIGGASGVGKSSISYPLSRCYDIGITEVDDFQVILEKMTTPEEQPAIHFWNTHSEEIERMTPDERLQIIINYADAMTRALELVVMNHLESNAPIILEGDFISPSLATNFRENERVRSIFITESSEEQILQNYQLRENSLQLDRAHQSWRYSEWIKAECAKNGIPAIEARPWKSVLRRVRSLLEN